MDLTFRQVSEMLKVIDKQKYNELAAQAQLHGKKLKPYAHELNLKAEERHEANKLAENTFERMKREYEKKRKAENG